MGRRIKGVLKMNMKIINIVMAIFLLLFTVLISVGCLGKSNETFDTDLFHCKYNKDKTGIVILELTQKGQEQEILVIPEEINGLPVVQLGGTTSGYPYQSHHYIKSSLLKKVYLNNSNDFGLDRLDVSQPIEIIALKNDSYYSTIFKGNRYNDSISCFTTEEIYNNNVEKLSIRPKECFSVIGIANLTFIEIVDEKETIIWIDNISENSVYYCPYLERDWYTDRECTTLWDKEYKLPENREVLNLYSKTN